MNLDQVHELFEKYQQGKISRREFLRLSMLVGGAAAAQAILAACAPGQPTSPPGGQTPAGATPGAIIQPTRGPQGNITPQKLIYGASQDAPDIDPSGRTDYSIGALTIELYDRLFRYEGGWPQPTDPSLCTKFESSADSKEWTFHLTDKAKFHDGTPLTSDAVKFSINRTLALKKPRANLLLPLMDDKSVQTPDNTTVKVTLTQPYAELPRAMRDTLIMNPKLVTDHNVGGDQGAQWLLDHEAGSGPFTIKSWTVGTAYELEAFPDYWAGWPGDGRLSGFVWRIIRESSSRRIALLSKEVDVIDTVSADDIDTINKTSGFTVQVNYGTLTGYFKLNNTKDPTANEDFRRFLAYSFNYESYKTVLKGNADLLKGVIPSGHPYFDPSVGNYTYDPAKAKAALDKTPWKNGGTSLDFVYVTGLDFEEQAGLILLSELQKYNIKLNMVPKVFPDMVSACKTPQTGPNLSMIFTGYQIPDQWFFFQWYSPNWDRPTGGDYNNCSFFKDDNFNKLVEKVRVTTDEAEKKKIYSDMQRTIHDRAVEMPIFVQPNILGFRKRVQGYKYYGAIAVNFWRLWIDDSKDQ